MDINTLESWLKKRKKRLKEEMDKNTKPVGLPGGLTIHINVGGEKSQKLPLTADGKFLATRDSVAKYPS